MMELSLISFEQFEALKKLGFTPHLVPSNTIIKPTLELASKWLRDERNMLIVVDRYDSHSDLYIVYIRRKYGDKFKETILIDEQTEITFYSFEDALSAGIDKCIQILNNK